MPLRLNPIQREYIRNATPRDIILKPRQIGMTTVLLARDLYRFLTIPGARVVVVCQSKTGDGPLKGLARTLRLFFDCLAKAGLQLDLETANSSEWALKERGSTLRIITAGASEAAALKVGRSGTITHLHLTEVAFWEWPEQSFAALAESVPAMEFGSEIVIESTPNGAAGFYYERWQKAARALSGYKPHFFKWWEYPEYATPLEPGEVVEFDPDSELEQKLARGGVTPEQLKWYRAKREDAGPDKTAQEFPTDPESCFLISGRPFFDLDAIQKLIHRATNPIRVDKHGALRVWKEPVKGEPATPENHWQGKKPREYVVAVDTAEGESSEDNDPDKADYCAALVLDRETGEHVATLHGRFPPHDFGALLVELATHYNGALIGVERNLHGHAVHNAIFYTIGYHRVYRAPDEKLGWLTNAQTRPPVLDGLDDAIRKGFFTSPDMLFLGECRTFIITKKGRPEAAKGAHDDTVMAAAIGWKIRELPLYDSTDEVDVSTMV